jgi:hypothetical protein
MFWFHEIYERPRSSDPTLALERDFYEHYTKYPSFDPAVGRLRYEANYHYLKAISSSRSSRRGSRTGPRTSAWA